MANYKVVDADQLDVDMKAVANAIRAKAGTTASMSFPDGYVSAIRNIEEGADLPILVNPGTEADALKDKEFINQAGEIVSGTIVSKSASSVTVSNDTVNIPSGYYPEAVSKSVAHVEQSTPEISLSSSGLITSSVTQEAGYVAGGTKSATKQLSAKSAETFVPTTKNQTIPAGTYLSGAQTITGDPNLKAENIADGVTIFNIEGTHVGGIVPSGTKTVTENGVHDVTEYESVNVALPTATLATPSISVDSSGKITATVTQSTTGIVEAGTKTNTKNLSTQAAKSITPKTSSQTAVSSGKYTTGAITVKGDANLVPGNIKSGTSIFGVVGDYAPAPSSIQSLFPVISVSDSGLIEAEAAVESAYYTEGSYASQKQLDTKGAQSWTPTTNNQTIPAGTYLTGNQVIVGDSNLVASNIAKGISLFGLTGTYSNMPSAIAEITHGYCTPASDASFPYYINHGMSSTPHFFIFWQRFNTSPRAGYLAFSCGVLQRQSNVSNLEVVKLMNWCYDASLGRYSFGTYWDSDAGFDTSQVIPVLANESYAKLKSGVTYQWMAIRLS